MKLKMSGPKGVITISGSAELSLRTKQQKVAFMAEAEAKSLAGKGSSEKKAKVRKCDIILTKCSKLTLI